jgi:hypothetical protein
MPGGFVLGRGVWIAEGDAISGTAGSHSLIPNPPLTAALLPQNKNGGTEAPPLFLRLLNLSQRRTILPCSNRASQSAESCSRSLSSRVEATPGPSKRGSSQMSSLA